MAKNGLFMAKTWSSHGPSNWFFLNLNHYAQGYSIPNFLLLGASFSPLSKKWPKHGPLIIVPREVTRQISHCWVFPVAPLPKNGQNMALLWQNMVHTWSSPSWPKHGLHLVLKIGSTWILINMPRDVPCQISHCQVYPVVPFLKNGQNMALLLPKHGPHMVVQIGSNLNLNHCAQICSMPNFTLPGLSCSPLS